MIQPNLINLYPNEYTQVLSYSPFAVNLHRCTGSSNTLINDLSNKICAPNKTEYLKLNAFDMIAGINE